MNVTLQNGILFLPFESVFKNYDQMSDEYLLRIILLCGLKSMFINPSI